MYLDTHKHTQCAYHFHETIELVLFISGNRMWQSMKFCALEIPMKLAANENTYN